MIPNHLPHTLSELFLWRIQKTPSQTAYCQYVDEHSQWQSFSWAQCAVWVLRYQNALLATDVRPGERVAVMLRNCVEWVFFDQAAMGLGLVVVPIFSEDNAENCEYILRDSDARLLFLGNEQQVQKVAGCVDALKLLDTVVCAKSVATTTPQVAQTRIVGLADWLSMASPPVAQQDVDACLAELRQNHCAEQDALASLVYTSGTTGKPKGVMLTHKNILSNIYAVEQVYNFEADDRFLSFLPLSHVFERVCSYYLAQRIGACVCYARSVNTLAQDLLQHRPTILFLVPRVYERFYMRLQKKFSAMPAQIFLKFCIVVCAQYRSANIFGKILYFVPWWLCDQLVATKVRAAFGGKVRCAISGGAGIPQKISRVFHAFGVPICQGYGLTESAPVISVDVPDRNEPSSVGFPIPSVEVRLGGKNELLTRSGCVMKGYWKLPQATHVAIDAEGWLHTGDMASIAPDGRIHITGRIKEIIVMSNGEKVSPVDIEMEVVSEPLISQIMVYGEGRAFLIALIVPNKDMMEAQQLNLEKAELEKLFKKIVMQHLKKFPGYTRIRRILLLEEPWEVANGMLTPTLKPRRERIVKKYQQKIDRLYAEL